MTVFRTVQLLSVVLAVAILVPRPLASVNYHVVRSSADGPSVFVTDTPSVTLRVKSRVHCSVQCNTNSPGCKSFNYKKPAHEQQMSVCELYTFTPLSFDVIPNCEFRQEEGEQLPIGVGCPVAFTFVESVNGCYLIENRLANWQNAAARCAEAHRKSHLIVINDHAEQLAVENTMTHWVPNAVGFWTAGHRVNNEAAEFMWTPINVNGDFELLPMNYANWRYGEPNNSGNNEDCVEIQHEYRYAWNDRGCAHVTHYICEIDLYA